MKLRKFQHTRLVLWLRGEADTCDGKWVIRYMRTGFGTFGVGSETEVAWCSCDCRRGVPPCIAGWGQRLRTQHAVSKACAASIEAQIKLLDAAGFLGTQDEDTPATAVPSANHPDLDGHSVCGSVHKACKECQSGYAAPTATYAVAT